MAIHNGFTVSLQITNHLFEEEGKGFGMDLVALNLQRGRDHGNITFIRFQTKLLNCCSSFYQDYPATMLIGLSVAFRALSTSLIYLT